MKVLTGLDVLVSERFEPLRGRRVGAICNQTSVDSRMRHLADHLHHAADVTLVSLFGPEHGVRGDAQDMIGVGSVIDERTGVPVHSLYGSDVSSLTPTAEQLDGIDILLFDVQDVGSRYYTFAATMLYAMKAASAKGISFHVLDRPNPIGGVAVEGPTVSEGFESFVGAYPMPIRHGMTVGELALMFKSELQLDLDVSITPCAGWNRSQFWRETDIPWVAPSPNMPTPETALVYPGGCLIEGTNLSEGRGTTQPFELWGAPWLNPEKSIWCMKFANFVDILRNSSTADIDYYRISDPPRSVGPMECLFRPSSFRPTFHKHAGSVCHGVQPLSIDPTRFRAVSTYTLFIAWARSHAPRPLSMEDRALRIRPRSDRH